MVLREIRDKFVSMLPTERCGNNDRDCVKVIGIIATFAVLVFMGLNFAAANGSVSGPVIGTTWIISGLAIGGIGYAITKNTDAVGTKTVLAIISLGMLILGSMAAGGATEPHVLGWTVTGIFLIGLGGAVCSVFCCAGVCGKLLSNPS